MSGEYSVGEKCVSLNRQITGQILNHIIQQLLTQTQIQINRFR